MNNSLLIKVCGITCSNDLAMISGMGTHFCGFIFHPRSPRYITPERAAAINSAHIRRVGVFVQQDADEMADIMRLARLDFAQLHGTQTQECARRLGAQHVIRVLWPENYESVTALQREMEAWADSCAWFLLDAGNKGGGHGRPLPWSHLAQLKPPRPWMLAGGLSAATSATALSQCHPNGLDLNSGVEVTLGHKSPQKLLATFKKLNPFTTSKYVLHE